MVAEYITGDAGNHAHTPTNPSPMEEGREKFKTLLKAGSEREARALITSGHCKADSWAVICATCYATDETLVWLVHECGAPVDELAAQGMNALQWSFSIGHFERARTLLFQCGADPLVRTEGGHSLFDVYGPYMDASEAFDYELASYLLRRGVTRDPLRQAAWGPWYRAYGEMCVATRSKAVCFLGAARRAKMPKDVARIVAQAIWRERATWCQHQNTAIRRKRTLHYMLFILVVAIITTEIIICILWKNGEINDW